MGYIIGPQTAGVMFAGGVLLVAGADAADLLLRQGRWPIRSIPAPCPLRQMGPSDLWITYIRPMGAGAVAAAGLITLVKTLPTIVTALSAGIKHMRNGAQAGAAKPIRTEKRLFHGCGPGRLQRCW